MTAYRVLSALLVCMALVAIGAGCGHERVLTPAEVTPDSAESPLLASGSNQPKAAPPTGTPHGMSYGEWSNSWWQWLLSAPADVNPALDETGGDIAYDQSGSVWFLSSNRGGTMVRNAVIPLGRSLLIEVAGFLACPQTGDGTTEAELRAAAASAADNVGGVYLAVDGVPLSYNLPGYRVQSPEPFGFTVPEDNLLDHLGYPTPAGDYYPAVSDGWFVMLAPLPAGAHTIQIMALVPAPDIVRDVTINLFVGEVQQKM